MNWLIVLMIAFVLATLGAGLWLAIKPLKLPEPAWLKRGLLANLLLFGVGVASAMVLGVNEVMAAEPVATTAADISMGKAVALLAIGLPTALAALAAAYALAAIGSAALAVLAEKPELFGRTLVYMGLAEGVAIYGLVMSILLLGKL